MAHAEYDFIVVGAGPAGCSLASGLAQSTSKPAVLLLEAGGDASDPALAIPADRLLLWMNPAGASVDHGYKSTPQPQLNGREIAYPRGKGLGGSTLNNMTVFDYGSKADLDEWASLVGDETWNWKNAVRKFKEMENFHNDTPDEFKEYVSYSEGAHGTSGPIDISFPSVWEAGQKVVLDVAKEWGFPLTTDINNDQGIGIGAISHNIYKGFRISAARAYLHNKPENLTIVTNAPVARVLFESKRAIGVETWGGSRYLAKRDVILSAGTLDTPKILLLSGIGPKEELEKHSIPIISEVPYVGKGLRDHTMIRTQRLIKPGAVPSFKPYDREEELKRWLKDQSGPLGELNGYFALGYLKLLDTKVETWPEFQALPERDRVLMTRPDVPDWELSLRIVPIEPGGPMIVQCNPISMHAQSRGSVTLNSADPKDPPVIDLQYLTHPYDKRLAIEIVRASQIFIRDCSIPTEEVVLGPKSLSDKDIWEFVRETIGPVFHTLGTVKMGKAGEEETCVDPSFRVLGIENLRVADLSICPVLPCNHTQSTAYLVGVTAAEKLIEEYHL